MSSGHSEYLKILDEMRELHLRKSADYGADDDQLQNLRGAADIGIEPWKGCWLRALDKVRRINQFCKKGTLANEGVEDSLLDLAAYALLALTLRREAQGDQIKVPKVRLCPSCNTAYQLHHDPLHSWCDCGWSNMAKTFVAGGGTVIHND
jgi:hypothetical protein